MTQVHSRTITWRWLGALLGALAGLWGVTIILIFVVSTARMIEAGTPWQIVWSIDGPAYVALGLQLVGYAAIGTLALLAGIGQVRHINWLRLMLVLSLASTGLSLIPFSTIGPLNLPAAVGALAGSLLLLFNRAGESNAPLAARQVSAPRDR